MKTNPYSYTPVYLEGVCKGHVISSGTGFLLDGYEAEPQPEFLVSNWHVFTNRDPLDSAKLLPRMPESPTSIRAMFWKKGTGSERTPTTFEFPLYGPDKTPHWMEHPQREELGIDVAIIAIFPANECHFKRVEIKKSDVPIAVMSDLYIPGFAFGMALRSVFPVWKRATVASELLVFSPQLKRWHDAPFFLADTASRPGMSGSPVFSVADGMSFLPTDASAKSDKNEGATSVLDGMDLNSMTPTKILEFEGIYSGRVGMPNEQDFQLGKVWRKEIIGQIMHEMLLGKLDPSFVNL